MRGKGHYYKFHNTKTKKNIKKFASHHYIESHFLVHHYYYNQNNKNGFLVDHYYDTFNVLILPMASKKITTSKIKNQLPMAYYLWLPRPVGPWGVRLGSIRLG